MILFCIFAKTKHEIMKLKAVITGDIIRSTDIELAHRQLLLSTIENVTKQLESYSPMKLQFFRGDSFQIVLEDISNAAAVTIMLRAALKSATPQDEQLWDARVALGVGTIDFESGDVVTSDGEAFRLSGRGLDNMKGQSFGVFTPWKDTNDELELTSLFVDKLITGWKKNQAAVIFYSIGMGMTQIEIATIMNTSQQNVSRLLGTASESFVIRYINRYHQIIERNTEQ